MELMGWGSIVFELSLLCLHLLVFPLGQKEVKVEWSMGHLLLKLGYLCLCLRFGETFFDGRGRQAWGLGEALHLLQSWLGFLGGLIFLYPPLGVSTTLPWTKMAPVWVGCLPRRGEFCARGFTKGPSQGPLGKEH